MRTIAEGKGVLDGITLFRYAHMWMDMNAGGVEAYLANLNRYLLQRNKMRILQMYLRHENQSSRVEIEQIGKGELVWIPSCQTFNSKSRIRILPRLWSRLIRLCRRGQQNAISHDVLFSTLSNYRPNLAVFHWISEDSEVVIDYFRDKRIPIAVINHFQNARLKRRMIRKQISKAHGIGGVSDIGVPAFLRSQFTNLSDGVDTDYFHLDMAKPLARINQNHIILLPARITKQKGHIDAVRALGMLVRLRMSVALVFAGKLARDENTDILYELQKVIEEESVRDRVIFAGDLSPEELRNWYAASSIVLLPSYSEGLGKVLLEAQAMERPVIAYDAGGVSEAIRHLETGYLVKKGDIEGLSRKIEEIIKEPSIRHEMGEQGRKYVVERFSMEELTKRHEEFYAKILPQ